jgi:hypothetical protein
MLLIVEIKFRLFEVHKIRKFNCVWRLLANRPYGSVKIGSTIMPTTTLNLIKICRLDNAIPLVKKLNPVYDLP